MTASSNPAIQAADELTRSMDEFGTEVAGLKTQIGRNRKQAVRAVIFLVVLTLVAILFALFSWQTTNTANSASNRSQVNQDVAYQTCLANNKFRTGDKQLWAVVFKQLPTGDAPEIAIVQKQIDITFALRDCKKMP